ncbi:MAG: hypothetical protein KDI62_17225 [Anaerolineae bacterium]|nr:hypothetical protein [Anaerolineae bacterium]
MLQLNHIKLSFLLILVVGLTACGGASNVPATSSATSSTTDNEVNVDPTSETASASAEEEVDPSSESESAVVVLTATSVDTLDPYLMSTVHPEGSVAAHIWDTLIWINDDLELEPRLAESWRLINNLTWEIKLRPDVTFDNGEPFDSEAVRFSVERAQSLAGSLETFATDVNLDQVEVIDDYTVRFHTREPSVNFPYYLASLEMLPPGYYGDENSTGGAVETPVGSGPYQFVERSPEGRITLKARANYWAGPPTIETLIFQSESDEAQRIADLAEGRADIITDLTPTQAAAWDPTVGELQAVESTRRIFIGLRIENGTPLADKQVRQALNYAIDVQAIVDELLGGYGQRYGSWVNPPQANIDLTPWPYDPDKARELLAEAGYEDGFDIVLDTPIEHYHQDLAVAETVAEQLKNIGVNVQIQSYDWDTYVDNYLLPQQTDPLFLLGLNSRGNGLEDANNLSVRFPFNLTRWQNPEFEQLLQEASTTFNDDQRQTLLNQAQDIAYEEAPWIWLWRQYDFYGTNSQLDWQPRPDGLIYLY